MAERSPWIAPLSPSQTLFLDKLSSEILALIANEIGHSSHQNSLCKVNKTCNTACTHALYSGRLVFVNEQSLSLFTDTILYHRPELANLVKDLDIDGLFDLTDRASSLLAALTNLRHLTLIASGFDAWSAYCTFFHPVPFLPALRHLEICFSLDAHVLDFVQLHYLRLSSLSILSTVDVDDEDNTPATGAAELCTRYSLPLPLSQIACSPFLAPIFLPGSRISDVGLFWPTTSEDVDDVAPIAVHALASSGCPVLTVSYTSWSWNLKFIELSATQLQHMELLLIDNVIESLTREESSPDSFFRPLLNTLDDTLPLFKSLKALHLICFYEDSTRTFYDDFRMVRKWASHCPTLLYCKIPGTNTLWIRHPSYRFFVPHMKGSRMKANITSQWVQELFAKEGLQLATSFLQQYKDLRKDGIVDVVDALWKRACK